MVHSGRVTALFTDVHGILHEAVATRAFPAAVIEVGRSASPVWRQAVGTLTYDVASAPAREDTIFDLASLTKVLSTTPLIMRLVERGGVGLDDPVALQSAAEWPELSVEALDLGGSELRELLEPEEAVFVKDFREFGSDAFHACELIFSFAASQGFVNWSAKDFTGDVASRGGGLAGETAPLCLGPGIHHVRPEGRRIAQLDALARPKQQDRDDRDDDDREDDQPEIVTKVHHQLHWARERRRSSSK